MANMNPTGPGTFCWYELATTDPQAAKKFYKEIFGWDAKDFPMPEGGPGGMYTMFELGGKTVGGMYLMPPEMKQMNVPPNWASYITVENIEKSFEQAKKLGASGLTPIMEVGDMGRSVMIKDPTGAAFALWQVKGNAGNPLLEQVHGNRCWNELLTSDVDRAGKFYAELFGWKLQAMKMPNGDYTVFSRGKDMVGGMMVITQEMGPMPPNWMVYYETDHCDRTLEQAKKAHAQIPMPAVDVPEVGRIAAVIDPQGAAFGLVQSPKK